MQKIKIWLIDVQGLGYIEPVFKSRDDAQAYAEKKLKNSKRPFQIVPFEYARKIVPCVKKSRYKYF